jgi:hypothetical protein
MSHTVSKWEFILCEISDQKKGFVFVLPYRDPTHKPSDWAMLSPVDYETEQKRMNEAGV